MTCRSENTALWTHKSQHTIWCLSWGCSRLNNINTLTLSKDCIQAFVIYHGHFPAFLIFSKLRSKQCLVTAQNWQLLPAPVLLSCSSLSFALHQSTSSWRDTSPHPPDPVICCLPGSWVFTLGLERNQLLLTKLLQRSPSLWVLAPHLCFSLGTNVCRA